MGLRVLLHLPENCSSGTRALVWRVNLLRSLTVQAVRPVSLLVLG